MRFLPSLAPVLRSSARLCALHTHALSPLATTQYALSTPPGSGGIAVVRLSGPSARPALEALTRRPPPPPRVLHPATLRDLGGRLLDRSLVAFFPRPHSFTGEDVIELHLHGGRAVVASLLSRLAELGSQHPEWRLTPAGPGDFTRTAFVNGKLDLRSVEALGDLLAADTEAQRAAAAAALDGRGLGPAAVTWRTQLLSCLAQLEAVIEFGDDEEGIDDAVWGSLDNDVAAVAASLWEALAAGARGELLRTGVSVVLLGGVNVGKSSLMNALARRPAAIVSSTPGTTRDVVEVRMDLGGLPVTLSDTAGLRPTDDPVEAEGCARSIAAAGAASVVVAVVDGQSWGRALLPPLVADAVANPRTLVVVNKLDSGEPLPRELAWRPRTLPTSCLTGRGVSELMAALEAEARAAVWGGGDTHPSAFEGAVRSRHTASATDAHAALTRFLGRRGGSLDLAAEDLRCAVAAVARLAGEDATTEQMLDHLFAKFCIGK